MNYKKRNNIWDKQKEVIALYNSFSILKIAEVLKMSPSSVYNILTHNSIEIKGPKFFEKDKHNSPDTEFKKGNKTLGNKTKELWKNKEYRNYMSRVHIGQKSWSKGLKGEEFLKHFKNHKIWNGGLKGIHFSPRTEFKNGNHPKTEIKKGQHLSIKTEFKKGYIQKPEILKKRRLSFINSEKTKGIKHWNWHNGASFEPYGIEFNKYLKKQIMERDNYRCQECNESKNQLKKALHVHHIDYNKRNNNPLNLISLCSKCHIKTNKNREHWVNYFKMKMFIKELVNPQNILIFKENKQLVGMEKIPSGGTLT